MTDRTPDDPTGMIPLGLLACPVTVRRPQRTRIIAGLRPELRRLKDNPREPHAIEVSSGLREPLGWLPRATSAWLAPLIDAGRVALRPLALRVASPSRGEAEFAIDIEVFLTRQGAEILHTRGEGGGAPHVLHRMLVRLWRRCERARHNQRMGQDIAIVLARLDPRQLLPESNLLLNLLPTLHDYRRRLDEREQALGDARRRLGAVQFGEPVRHGSLALIPLLGSNGHVPSYELLHEALSAGKARVDELNPGGVVPFLKIVNESTQPLLVCEGMLLIAPKQNRVVNESLLVPNEMEFALPVSCVEQGRWHRSGRAAEVRGGATALLRSRKLRTLLRRRDAGYANAAQGEVWVEGQACLREMDAPSPTHDLDAVYDTQRERLRTTREALMLPREAVGVVIARDDRILGLELMDHPSSFRTTWDKLADGYYVEALRRRRPPEEERPAELSELSLRWFLGRVADSLTVRWNQTGAGIGLALDDPRITGSGVWHDGRLCQLCALAVE